jgi:ubiquitin C-terminal hydrolase
MNTKNICESPLGGYWRECEKTNKDGEFIGYGVGKTVAEVSYYNKSQGRDNIFTYDMCKDCVNFYRDWLVDTLDDDTEDNVVVSIKHFNKKSTEHYNQITRTTERLENDRHT